MSKGQSRRDWQTVGLILIAIAIVLNLAVALNVFEKIRWLQGLDEAHVSDYLISGDVLNDWPVYPAIPSYMGQNETVVPVKRVESYDFHSPTGLLQIRYELGWVHVFLLADGGELHFVADLHEEGYQNVIYRAEGFAPIFWPFDECPANVCTLERLEKVAFSLNERRQYLGSGSTNLCFHDWKDYLRDGQGYPSSLVPFDYFERWLDYHLFNARFENTWHVNGESITWKGVAGYNDRCIISRGSYTPRGGLIAAVN